MLALAARAALGQQAGALPATGPAQPQPPAVAIPAPFLAGSSKEFRALIDAREYTQAVTLAKRLLEAAEQQPGPDGEDLQVALMNLALAQYLDQDYVGAESSYLRVISLIEASGRMTTPRLARAQAGLATTYYAGKRYDLAAARYEQAIALARRQQGLFTEEQIPFLEKYANALSELNRYEDALKARRYILRTIARKYGDRSLQYAQQLESTGRWLTRIGSYDAARATLRSAIGITEDAKGENAVELIGPLTALGDCARRQLLDPATARAASADEQRQSMFQGGMAPVLPTVSPNSIAIEGQSALERAVAIASAQAPPSPARLADVRTLLGDWYQSRQRTDKALPIYQLAWQAAGDSTVGGKPVTQLLFDRPVLLAYVPPGSWNRYADRPAGEVVLREAQLSFTVTARGRVADPQVVSDAGDPARGTQVLRAAQSAIYRPRLENGAPADTPGVTLTQPYYVLVETEAAEPAKAAATPPAGTSPQQPVATPAPEPPAADHGG